MSDIEAGSYIDNNYCVAPICANDMVLVSSNLRELQLQLSMAENYEEEEWNTIHTGKTRIVQLGMIAKN